MDKLAVVKRIVALQRASANARAMAKRGVITEGDAGVLIEANDAEIARLRSQGELPLDGGKKAK